MVQNDTTSQTKVTKNFELESTKNIVFHSSEDFLIEKTNNISSENGNKKIEKNFNKVFSVNKKENQVTLNLPDENLNNIYKTNLNSSSWLEYKKFLDDFIIIAFICFLWCYPDMVIKFIIILIEILLLYRIKRMKITMILLVLTGLTNVILKKNFLKKFEKYNTKKIVNFCLIVYFGSFILLILFKNTSIWSSVVSDKETTDEELKNIIIIIYKMKKKLEQFFELIFFKKNYNNLYKYN